MVILKFNHEKNIHINALNNNCMGFIRVTEHTRLPPSGIWVVYVHNLVPHHTFKTREVLPRLEPLNYESQGGCHIVVNCNIALLHLFPRFRKVIKVS